MVSRVSGEVVFIVQVIIELQYNASVIDLIGRMDTKDKIAQLGHSAPGIDSLKIPGYQWWSEALHGVAGSPGVHFGGNV